MNAVDFFRRGRMSAVDFLRERGYPKKILGNSGYEAVLKDIQPLIGGDFAAIYRYPRGEVVLGLEDVKRMKVVER